MSKNKQHKDYAASGEASTSKKSVKVVQDLQTSTVSFPVESVPYEQSEEKSLVRKIDCRIMPYLWGYAVLSAVDVRNKS